MAIASKVIKELLENGVHFGHQTNKWNPKMKKFIFGEKSGIYIIDLRKTEKALKEAVDFVYELTASGKTVLFAGTKKQARRIVQEEAIRCEMFYIDERWLGGCLTNFATIRKSIEKLNNIQKMKEGEVYETLAKKEKAQIDHTEQKLLKNLKGIRDMEKLPDCLIVVDAESEDIAIKEARKIGIPVVALIDTNCDPDVVDFPIPGNDDAIRSIQYVMSTLADAAKKGSYKFSGKKLEPVDTKKIEVVEVQEEEAQKEEVAEESAEATIEEAPEEPKVETLAAEELLGEEKKKSPKKHMRIKKEAPEGDIMLDDEADDEE